MTHLAVEIATPYADRTACGAIIGQANCVAEISYPDDPGPRRVDCPRCLVAWDHANDLATADKGVWERLREAAR